MVPSFILNLLEVYQLKLNKPSIANLLLCKFHDINGYVFPIWQYPKPTLRPTDARLSWDMESELFGGWARIGLKISHSSPNQVRDRDLYCLPSLEKIRHCHE